MIRILGKLKKQTYHFGDEREKEYHIWLAVLLDLSSCLLSRLRVVEHPLHVVADPRVHAGDALGAAKPRAEAHDPDYPPDGQWFWPTSFLHFTKVIQSLDVNSNPEWVLFNKKCFKLQR